MASEQERTAAARQRSAAARPDDAGRGDVTPRQATDRPRSTRASEPGPLIVDSGPVVMQSTSGSGDTSTPDRVGEET